MMLAAGMNDYLWKPIIKNDLIHILKKWLPPQKLLDAPPVPLVPKDANEEFDEEVKGFWKRLERIEELDLLIGLNRVDGQKDVYKKSLEFMVKEIDKSEESLDAFLAVYNMEQFRIVAHGMKGSLANIGAMELSSKALALEKASRQKDIVYCAENLAPFLERLHRLSCQLKDAFSLICQRSFPVDIPPELALIYERLFKAIGDFNLQRIEEEVAALDALPLGGALKERIGQIKDLVMMMDYSGATELMRDAA
jgi:HPt (histidine-containing phosphotransfer) domain-containing protein